MGPAEYNALAHITGRLEFFAPLKGSELETTLSHIQLFGFSKGETIFKKGSLADAFYIIHEGEVRILMNAHWFWLLRRQARLAPGNIFGEMALLENRPHSATAVTARPSKLFVLLRADFDALLLSNPAFAEGMRWVAARRKFEDTH